MVRSFSKEEEAKVSDDEAGAVDAADADTLEESPPAATSDDHDPTSKKEFIPQSRRSSHLNAMIEKNQALLATFDLEELDEISENAELDVDATYEDDEKGRFRHLQKRFSVFHERVPERLVEVRVRDYSYHIPIKMDAPTVKTVGNQSVCYATYEFFRRIHQYRMAKKAGIRRASFWRPNSAGDVLLPFQKKPILSDINLVLKPGQTYLVLGPPASGKTSLLKAIAGRLPEARKRDGEPVKDKPHQEGRIEYNGVCALNDDPNIITPNVVSFVGQLDNHAPYLTVKETFEFAFQSRTGGRHESLGVHSQHLAADMDQQNFTENLTIEGLDLKVCENTFVGNENVRGVSGGQRRRVTVGGATLNQLYFLDRRFVLNRTRSEMLTSWLFFFCLYRNDARTEPRRLCRRNFDGS